MPRNRKFVWCPQDEHGDHEIHLEYVIHPGRPASYYGPEPHPAEPGVVEIVSASEGGMTRELAPHEYDMAVCAIEENEEWEGDE